MKDYFTMSAVERVQNFSLELWKAQIGKLSPREKEWFDLNSLGLSSKEVAERMEINVRTVERVCVNVRNKLQLDNKTQAAIVAVKLQERREP